MDARLVAAVSGSGVGVNVAGLCRQLGVSRQSFYKWRARYRAEGLAGLEERSRRPARSPGRVGSGTEEVIVEWRKKLVEQGLDAGAATIRWHLDRDGIGGLPSEATIWRVLVRRGFVVAQPSKRPRRAGRRFAAERPNERWQADHTDWVLAGGQEVQVLNLIDDCSRLCVASVAAPTVNSGMLWATFWAAGQAYGLPASCLTDNGLVFSGKLRGFEVDFEIRLRQAGIRAITSRPYHPQTCGKVERFQQTLKKWLAARAKRLATIAQLQAELDRFADYYNHQRPHRALGRATPAERWSATPADGPGETLPAPQRRSLIHVDQRGCIGYARRWVIHLGVEHIGQPAYVIAEGDHLTVFIHDQLVRSLQIDPARVYQPSGRPRGGPRRRPDTPPRNSQGSQGTAAGRARTRSERQRAQARSDP